MKHKSKLRILLASIFVLTVANISFFVSAEETFYYEHEDIVCEEEYDVASEPLEIKDMLVKLNILDENGFSDLDTITRGECLIAIMRVIGATDEEIGKLSGADFEPFADTAPYSYFGCAAAGKIAYGEEWVVEYPTHRTAHALKNTDFFFFPDRTVTAKECLAFMIRCLLSDQTDYDLTIENAKEIGLINVKDRFIQAPDSPIGQDDFFVLLERLLRKNRYKYYGRVNGVFKTEGNIDEARSVSYIEMLER